MFYSAQCCYFYFMNDTVPPDGRLRIAMSMGWWDQILVPNDFTSRFFRFFVIGIVFPFFVFPFLKKNIIRFQLLEIIPGKSWVSGKLVIGNSWNQSGLFFTYLTFLLKFFGILLPNLFTLSDMFVSTLGRCSHFEWLHSGCCNVARVAATLIQFTQFTNFSSSSMFWLMLQRPPGICFAT